MFTSNSRLATRYAALASLLLASAGLVSPGTGLLATSAAPSHQVEFAALRESARAFVPNMGQWNAQALFLARSSGVNVWLTEDGVVYDFHRFLADSQERIDAGRFEAPPSRRQGHVFKMEFVGGRQTSVRGEGLLEGKFNYFLGNDESKWATHVPRYAEARSEQVYDGVEARWYFDKGSPRYDLIVAPGTDPTKIGLRFVGANGLASDGKALKIRTSLGTVEQNGLFAYQRTAGGEVTEVPCEFRVRGYVASFEVGRYDRTRPLIIDPLLWSTFVGGTNGERALGVAADSNNNVVVACYASSTDLPVSVGAYDTSYNGDPNTESDAYVAKLSGNGSTLIYGTFLGGVGIEWAHAVDVDAAGNAVVVGYTQDKGGTMNFPVTAGSYDPIWNGVKDAFVTKISANGASLLWSTFLGGSGIDLAWGVAIDGNGNVIVAGDTVSGNFPTKSAFQGTHSSFTDAFVSKLSADGKTLVYSSYLGGNGTDTAYAVAVDGAGNAIIGGPTASSNLLVTAGAFDTTYGGGDLDCFMARVSPAGALLYSTYVGGSNIEYVNSIAADSAGNAIFGGYSRGLFPVTGGAFDTTFASGPIDGFVAKLSANGANLMYATYLGAGNSEQVLGVSVDGSGNAIATGRTLSTGFPTTVGAFDRTTNGNVDGFVVKLSANGSQMLYGTFLGGSGNDWPLCATVDGAGNPIVAGYTFSGDFPTTAGVFDRTKGGKEDVFISKLNTNAALVPAALDDAYAVNAKGTLNVASPGVLSNDSRATSATIQSFPLHAASFNFNANGSFSYSPDAAFCGVDTFTYRAQNTAGSSNVASVTITVRAVLSSVVADPATVLGNLNIEGTVTLTTPAKIGGVKAFFSDNQEVIKAEGYSVTIPEGVSSAPFSIPTTAPASSTDGKVFCTLSNGSGVDVNANVTIKPLPKAVDDTYAFNSNKTLSVSAPGLLANDTNLFGGTAVLVAFPTNAASFTFNANGSFSYKPNLNYIGPDSFTYKCQNAAGIGTKIGTVNLTVRAVLVSMTELNNPVTGGSPLTGMVNLIGVAPPGGITVYFKDGLNAVLSEGYSVVVPAGSASVNFSIPTTSVGAPVTGILTAMLKNGSGVNKSRNVYIDP